MCLIDTLKSLVFYSEVTIKGGLKQVPKKLNLCRFSSVMGLPLFVVVVVFCFLAGDANDKLTFICTYLNVKQFY